MPETSAQPQIGELILVHRKYGDRSRCQHLLLADYC